MQDAFKVAFGIAPISIAIESGLRHCHKSIETRVRILLPCLRRRLFHVPIPFVSRQTLDSKAGELNAMAPGRRSERASSRAIACS